MAKSQTFRINLKYSSKFKHLHGVSRSTQIINAKFDRIERTKKALLRWGTHFLHHVLFFLSKRNAKGFLKNRNCAISFTNIDLCIAFLLLLTESFIMPLKNHFMFICTVYTDLKICFMNCLRVMSFFNKSLLHFDWFPWYSFCVSVLQKLIFVLKPKLL